MDSLGLCKGVSNPFSILTTTFSYTRLGGMSGVLKIRILLVLNTGFFDPLAAFF